MDSNSSLPVASASIKPDVDDPSDEIMKVLTNSLSSPLAAKPTSLTGKYSPQGGGVNDNIVDISSSKHVNITCLHRHSSVPLCLGLIGVNKNSFCLKPKTSCNVSSHALHSFEPEFEHYYINKNQNGDSAWCEFKMDKQLGLKLKSQGINLFEKKSHEDWKLLFSSSSYLHSEPTSAVERAIKFMKNPINLELPMKTPAKQKLHHVPTSDEKISADLEKMEATAALLFITDDEKTDWQSALPEDFINYVTNLSEVTKTIFSDLDDLRTSLENFASLSDVSSDLTDINSALNGFKAVIGNNSLGIYPDIWTALNESNSINHNMENIQKLIATQQNISANITKCEDVLTSYGNHWKALSTNWLPLLQQHQSAIERLESASPKQTDVDDLLKAGLSNNGNTVSTPSLDASTTFDRLSKLEARIVTLESSLESNLSPSITPSMNHSPPRRDAFGYGSAGVSFKQYFFADEDSVKAWMKTHLSTPSHGLFVDLVSFTQIFGDDSYVERNVTLNDLYMSNKIGYQTMADAYVATSFENVLPAAYGCAHSSGSNKASSNVDMESQPELPGLPSFEKWDHTDGGTGRKYWITKECRKTAIQIDGMIRSQLEKAPQYLAKDLLNESIAMSEALFNFISTSYQDTFNSGRFDSSQAWQLTCKFVKRIFVELGDVRITARVGIHINDPWSSAAKFLFVTLRAHEVMHSFMRLDIKNHPSISSEMVKFICYSQPASDTSEVLSRLSATESMQRTHQSNISKLDLKAKKLDTWKADTDKLLKKLKEKAEIA